MGLPQLLIKLRTQKCFKSFQNNKVMVSVVNNKVVLIYIQSHNKCVDCFSYTSNSPKMVPFGIRNYIFCCIKIKVSGLLHEIHVKKLSHQNFLNVMVLNYYVKMLIFT